MSADYIEQDVVLSQDGVAVVLHDPTLNDVLRRGSSVSGSCEAGWSLVR
jgi:glycerophosphoryl diester phosphodiesterase